MKQSFSRAANAAPAASPKPNRPAMPSAEALLKQGITSRATIDLMAAQNPPAPRMEPRPADPVLWEEACRSAQSARQDLAQQVRTRFETRAQQMQHSFRQQAKSQSKGMER